MLDTSEVAILVQGNHEDMTGDEGSPVLDYQHLKQENEKLKDEIRILQNKVDELEAYKRKKQRPGQNERQAAPLNTCR